MSFIHYNAPAENSVSRWISLKVHGLIPSRSHLPVGDQSRQAHTQEECKVVQPVAKQAKIAHEEQRSPTFCSPWRGGQAEGEHTYFTLILPLVCNTIFSSNSVLFSTNATHLLFFSLNYLKQSPICSLRQQPPTTSQYFSWKKQ